MFIKYKEDKTNHIISFEAKQFLPLSYTDFVVARNRGFESLNITCLADSIEIENNGAVESKGKGKIDLPIKFRQPLPIYALVRGGWLPPFFVQPSNLLTDSNAVGNLEAINKGNAQPIYGQIDWWFKLFNESNLTINPLPYAIEGNQFRTPTLQELKSSFASASDTIRAKFPKANIVQYEDEHFQIAFDLITSLSEKCKRYTEFLIKAAPLITDSVAEQNLLDVESKILKFAQETKVDLKSLPVLTTLSCLYDDGSSGFAAARRILKPKASYTDEQAYNALADLNALEFFIGTIALSESHESFAFCTSDKAIVLLWSSFYFYNTKFDRDLGAVSSFVLSENLFPRLSGSQRKELAARLS